MALLFFMFNHEGAAKLWKIIKYAITNEQSHVQFQFPIHNSSFGYLILVITSRHPSDVFYWAGERSIPCLANHEEEAEPSSISTTPQRNNSTHNKSVWKTASTPDTGRYIQTCFKKLGGYNKCITRYLVRVCVCVLYTSSTTGCVCMYVCTLDILFCQITTNNNSSKFMWPLFLGFRPFNW